ncbi:MAG: hypothetical protein ACM3ML_08410 [Micromonosporaceae bacterium]
MADPACDRRGMMIWSDHEETLYQLRLRRRKILQRLTLVTLAHAVCVIVFEAYARHHRTLHALTVLVFAASLAGLASVAVLGARWGLNSNAAESWATAGQRRVSQRRMGLRAQRARRERAIGESTWRPRSSGSRSARARLGAPSEQPFQPAD